jgi:hypothetical protein
MQPLLTATGQDVFELGAVESLAVAPLP